MGKVLALAVVTIVLLSGCSDSGALTLTSDESDRPACADLTPITAANLETERTDCDVRGATLIFPDGIEMDTSAQTAAQGFESSDSPWKYHWAYVGNYGIVASKSTETCNEVETWGPPEAVSRLKEAFGANWPCDQ
jgi:hypothetical protein